MSDSFTLSSSAGSQALELQPDSRHETAMVTLTLHEGASLSSEIPFGDPANHRLAALFVSLARDWKGWKGVREWESEESALRLAASHDGLGHINLEIVLRRQRGRPGDWIAATTIVLDAGLTGHNR
jgi:hypothetical protein